MSDKKTDGERIEIKTFCDLDKYQERICKRMLEDGHGWEPGSETTHLSMTITPTEDLKHIAFAFIKNNEFGWIELGEREARGVGEALIEAATKFAAHKKKVKRSAKEKMEILAKLLDFLQSSGKAVSESGIDPKELIADLTKARKDLSEEMLIRALHAASDAPERDFPSDDAALREVVKALDAAMSELMQVKPDNGKKPTTH